MNKRRWIYIHQQCCRSIAYAIMQRIGLPASCPSRSLLSGHHQMNQASLKLTNLLFEFLLFSITFIKKILCSVNKLVQMSFLIFLLLKRQKQETLQAYHYTGRMHANTTLATMCVFTAAKRNLNTVQQREHCA